MYINKLTMTKIRFRPYIHNRSMLFPQRLDEDICANDPVRVVNAIIDAIDIENIKGLYSKIGRHPYHPKMMLKVIIYAYMNNIYSCRKIEQALKRDVHFIWLAGYEKPDFITINRFRNRVKGEINKVFSQMVLLLAERGFISLDVEYIDGTKIESKANKYTFVWRKSVERNRAKLQEKLKALLSQIDDCIAQENSEGSEEVEITAEQLSELLTTFKAELERTPEPVNKEEKKKIRERKKQIKQIEEHKAKLMEYDEKLEKLEDRNSYSKTDPSATFMRMKEDAMRNGQTKPGYNLQIATNQQFITNFGLFYNPTDTLTFIPFLQSHQDRYGDLSSTVVADSGYGSEENYRFMEESGTTPFVKYNRFHIEHRPRYKPDPFQPASLYYNKEGDYYVCPMGQRMRRIGTKRGKTASGYTTESARYKAARCEGCPLRGLCFKAKGNRIIEVNHRLNEYKKKASQLLTSEEGLRHRGRRCVEPESVFGQMKYNMSYKRFRHFGQDKVTMDFAFFAIAFNVKKLCSMMAKNPKNTGNTPHSCPNHPFLVTNNLLLEENQNLKHLVAA